MLWVGAGITVFYMFRQVYMTFFGEFRGTHEQEHHLHESPPSMAYVLIVLGVLSLVGGWLKWPEFIAHVQPFEEFPGSGLQLRGDSPGTEAGIHNHGIEAVFAVVSVIVWSPDGYSPT